MKITFIPHGYSPKPIGGLKIVYEYANKLVDLGHEVTVVHPDRLPNLVLQGSRLDRLRRWLNRKEEEPKYSTVTPELHWHPIDSRVRMIYVPEPKPSQVPDGDAVVATFWATAEYVIGFPREKGTKFYLAQDYGAWAGPKERVDGMWRASLYKIVISRWLYDLGVEIGVPENELIYVPNGIDHGTYRIVNPIAGRPPQVAMLYHKLAWKGSGDGIEALESVKIRYPKLRVVLFSIFPKPENLPKWIVYRCDPTQEEVVGSIYNGSSIYVCPSWSEGFGLPPAEAMACGCAIASTDCGGVRDFAEHEVTALLSPPKDPPALANNIIRLLNDDDLRIRLARAGNERIQKFTWKRSVSVFERALRDRIGQRTPKGMHE